MATKTQAATYPEVRTDEQAAKIQKMGDAEVIFRMGVKFHELMSEMQGVERSLQVGAYDAFLEYSDRMSAELGRLRAYASEMLNRRVERKESSDG